MLLVGETGEHRGDPNGELAKQGLSLWCVRVSARTYNVSHHAYFRKNQ